MKISVSAVMRGIAVIFMLYACFLSTAAKSSETVVDRIRFGSDGGRTRAVLDLTSSVDYEIFSLASPKLIVVDIKSGRLNVPSSLELGLLPPIANLSYDSRRDGSLRLVFQIDDGDFEVRDFTLRPDPTTGRGHRLVIDIFSKEAINGDGSYTEIRGADDLAGSSKTKRRADEVQQEIDPKAALLESEIATPSKRRGNAAAEVSGKPIQGVVEKNNFPPLAVYESPTETASESVKQDLPVGRELLVGFSGTWQHEWAWTSDIGKTQKFESIVQPRWDVRFPNGVDLTAIIRARGDAKGDLGPSDRKPPNYSDFTAPWYNTEHAELSLRELFLDFRVGSSDWRLGKQQVVWGQADGIKVLDVINPQSFREFILDDFDDSRIPLWMANVTVPLTDLINLQLLWVPDTTYHEIAEVGAPFQITTPRVVPQAPISAIYDVDKPDDPLSDSDLGAAFSGFIGGWDLSLNYFFRYLDTPSLPVRSGDLGSFTLQPEYRRSHLLGGSFSTAVGSIGVRGEVAYDSDTFQATSSVLEDFTSDSAELATVVGVDWALSMDALVSMQWFSSYLFDYERTMVRDEWEQTLSLLYQHDFLNANWRFRGIGIHSTNDGDWQLQLRISHWLSSDLEVWVGTDVFGGSAEGLFGQFDEFDRALVGFELGF